MSQSVADMRNAAHGGYGSIAPLRIGVVEGLRQLVWRRKHLECDYFLREPGPVMAWKPLAQPTVEARYEARHWIAHEEYGAHEWVLGAYARQCHVMQPYGLYRLDSGFFALLLENMPKRCTAGL